MYLQEWKVQRWYEHYICCIYHSHFSVIRIIAGQFGDGTCSSCDGGYAGANCEVSIPLVVVPTVVVVIAALSAIIIFTIWYMKRSASTVHTLATPLTSTSRIKY